MHADEPDLAQAAEAALIADVYKAAAGASSWSDALSALCDAIGVLGAQMIGVDQASGAIRFSFISKRVPSDAELAYVRTYHRHDPRIPMVLPRPKGEWLYDQDEISNAVRLTNPYYRDILRPTGSRYTAGVKLYEQSGEVGLMAFLSYQDALGFTEGHRRFISRVGYHLCEAGALYQHTRRVGEVAAAGVELVRRLERPTLVLSAGGRIEIANDAARDYLAANPNLIDDRNMLRALDRRIQQQLVDALTASFSPGTARTRRVLRVDRQVGDAAIVLSLTRFAPSETMFAFGLQPRVLAMVHRADHRSTADPMLWEAAFDLTYAEAQVAVLLARGLSAEEIASSRCVSLNTARTQIKSLMQKTGAQRQSDLVSRLLSIATTL